MWKPCGAAIPSLQLMQQRLWLPLNPSGSSARTLQQMPTPCRWAGSRRRSSSSRERSAGAAHSRPAAASAAAAAAAAGAGAAARVGRGGAAQHIPLPM